VSSSIIFGCHDTHKILLGIGHFMNTGSFYTSLPFIKHSHFSLNRHILNGENDKKRNTLALKNEETKWWLCKGVSYWYALKV
jgi:hypothetical protein